MESLKAIIQPAIQRFTVLILLSSLLGCSQSPGDNHPPTSSKSPFAVSSPEAQGMQSALLADMMAKALDSSYSIHSMVVIRNGHKVLEANFWPNQAEEPHAIYSVTKSIVATLIGIALEKGYLQSLDQPVLDFFPDTQIANPDPRKAEITIRDLLTMSSGLDCRDSSRYYWSGLKTLMESADWAEHVLSLPMKESPGQYFEYCNGVSFLLSAIVENSTGMGALAFADKHLFEPLEIDSVSWKQNHNGRYMGFSEMMMSPEDMAKIGQLYLNKGQWQGRQVLPQAWVEESTIGHLKTDFLDGYGYQWWIDDSGYYMAIGFRGQAIYVLPDQDMVVVFTGYIFDSRTFYTSLVEDYLIPSVRSDEPLPENEPAQQKLAALLEQAKEEGFSWGDKANGFAKDGVFTRKAAPAFSFQYPKESIKFELDHPQKIMRMSSPTHSDFDAAVFDLEQEVSYADAVQWYAKGLQGVGSDIRVESQEVLILDCGTEAYQAQYTWLYGGEVPLSTLVVFAKQENKAVVIAVHDKQYEWIARSLKFDKTAY
ncbi:serine hydrolase domain-containing protein [Corallincola spongiicola]|uniref:Class C beta-lactamase-related serine hydrolase n=1 Tax=Corallincola spongiicola TaxID=2520508 RepID=A0ABY1WLD8_9GAMM|nr:serine hydrolase [Corallincola spongiicola]TAA41723.1 class C beta-lactamase-related serine hydrolase [Corallincola spongiicola]